MARSTLSHAEGHGLALERCMARMPAHKSQEALSAGHEASLSLSGARFRSRGRKGASTEGANVGDQLGAEIGAFVEHVPTEGVERGLPR